MLKIFRRKARKNLERHQGKPVSYKAKTARTGFANISAAFRLGWYMGRKSATTRLFIIFFQKNRHRLHHLKRCQKEAWDIGKVKTNRALALLKQTENQRFSRDGHSSRPAVVKKRSVATQASIASQC